MTGAAFDLLPVASQNSNRKLALIATEVGDTGTLDLPGQTANRHRKTSINASPAAKVTRDEIVGRSRVEP